MNRLLLSTAAIAMLAAPTLAEAKKSPPAPAKHKIVKHGKAKSATMTTETKAK